MKQSSSTLLKAFIAVALALALPVAGTKLDADGKPPTIGKVLEFLGQLLSKSKAQGEAEAKIYAKFKCFCDDNKKSKSSEVKKLTEGTSKLGSEIEGLQASNGELSAQCAKLKTDIAANLDSQKQAKQIRSNAAKVFAASKADLTKAIGQMTDAIGMLAAIGGDQTKSSGGDHAKFMAGYKKKKSASFLGLSADVRNALVAASALLPPENRATMESLMQGPFTGSYTSQSASIVGLLKMMRDTFKSNLQASSEAENADVKAHAKLLVNLEGLEKELNKAYTQKQQELGENDSELGAKRLQLKASSEQKAAAEDFLAKMLPMCDTKTKEFNARKALRVNEEHSIAEALSILRSDPALKSFLQAPVESTSFLQMRSKQRFAPGHMRLEVQKVLERAGFTQVDRVAPGRTELLQAGARLTQLLQAGNPFSVVFKEVRGMEELIDKEQKEDAEKHAFCKKQTDKGKAKLKKTNDEIDNTQEAINKLDETVKKPQTGLNAQEDALEKSMEENVANQKKETTMRQQENTQYQKNVAQMVKAETLLGRAIKVLEKFYSSLDEKSGKAASLVQGEADPKPPSTWSGAYEGQSGDAQSQSGAIGMLKLILADTKRQHNEAHKGENDAQIAFEDSMAKLKKEQADQQKSVVELKSAQAKAQLSMVDKKQDLKQAKKDKVASKAYLADIKPGCDFIFKNFDLRTKNRKTEAAALAQATNLLKKSPAYQTASAEAEAAALGACKSKCVAPDHVKCKACLAHVSVPGYCAGHKGTPGC